MGNKSKYQSQEPPKGFDLDYYQELYKTLKTPIDWSVTIYNRYLVSFGWLQLVPPQEELKNLRYKNLNSDNYFQVSKLYYKNMYCRFITNIDDFILEIADGIVDLSLPITYLNRVDVLDAGIDILEEYQNKLSKTIKFKEDLFFDIVDCLGMDMLISQKYDINNPITYGSNKSIAIKINLSAPKNLLMKEFEKLIDEVHKSDLYKDRATIKKPFSATYEQELKKLLPLIDMMLFNQHFNYTMTATQYSRFVYPDYGYSDNYIRDFIKRIKTTILTSEYLLWLYQNNVDL
ncbi:hypothetical protein [Francisella philomiragia]|uniref:hypothetical protein n=1 Tax=Francisella philomiragia TaxID=28110 RepID=UPI00351875B5